MTDKNQKNQNTRSFNWVDVLAMLTELKKYITNSKVDKIYNINKNSFQIRFHNPKYKKRNLIINLPNFFFLTTTEFEKPIQPSSFVMYLRKHLQNSKLKDVRQLDYERIILLIFEKIISNEVKHYHLYVEFIKPGNIILCDEDDIILQSYKSIEFSTRTIKQNQKYNIPPRQNHPYLDKDSFINAFKYSNKKSIVKTLAIDFSLGGFYSELLLKILNIDKTLQPQNITENSLLKIYDLYLSLIQTAKYETDKESFLCKDKIFSFVFSKEQKKMFTDCRFFDTYSKAIESFFKLNNEQEENRENSKIKKLEKIITLQQKELDKSIEQYLLLKRQGEAIYKHYNEISYILSKIKELRKRNISYEEIQNMLINEGFTIEINPNKNELIIDFDD